MGWGFRVSWVWRETGRTVTRDGPKKKQEKIRDTEISAVKGLRNCIGIHL